MNITKLHRFFFACLVFICLAFSVDARTVTGKVKDELGGRPLQGVIVALRGSNNSVSKVTNTEGEFSIEVPDGPATLVITYVGYQRQEVDVTGKSTVEVFMESLKMEEVVVTGYTPVKRANVLGAVASVKGSEIEDLPVANLATALVGRVPGVSISQSSGKPGSTTSITIRKAQSLATSFGSLEPLYVIDGIALDVSIGKITFDNLDATMVESINFLKDAAATIYGSRATNGVIVVVTKKGQAGKIKISYSGSYGLSYAPFFPKMLSGYDQAVLLNGKYTALDTNGSLKSNIYTDDELAYLQTHNYDNLKELWQNSHLQRHTLNISGGTEKLTYFAGANYLEQNGNFKNTDAKRIGVRFGTMAKITDNFTANIQVSVDNSYQDRLALKSLSTNTGGTVAVTTDQSDQMNGTVGILMYTPQWYPAYNNGLPVNTGIYSQNPSALLNSNGYAKSNNTGISVNGLLEYKVTQIKGLSFRVQYGLNNRFSVGKEYYPNYNTYNFQTQGVHNTPGNQNPYNNLSTRNVILLPDTLQTGGTYSVKNGDALSLSNTNTTSYVFNQGLTYANKFGKHEISVLALAEQSETGTTSNFNRSTTQIIPGVDQIWAFSTVDPSISVGSIPTEGGRLSYLGKLNYAYNDRYLFEGTFRADASTNFPAKNRWGYFHSEAIGWKISEESFFKDNITKSTMSNLKLRFQLGYTGNDQVRPYIYLDQYNYLSTTGYLYGTTYSNGTLRLNNTPNYNIGWETSRQENLGIDATMFNDHFNGSLDFFQRLGYNMITTPTGTIPTTVGIATGDINYGKVRTKGIEGNFSYNFKVKGVRFDLGANFSFSDNRLVKDFISINDTGYKTKILRRTDNGIEGLITEGIFRSQAEVDAYLETHPNYKINGYKPLPGYMYFKDVNGDGVITALDYTKIANRSSSIIGFGINVGASWNNFRLSSNIGLSVGGTAVYDKAARTGPNEVITGLSMWKDSWTPSNPNAKYPAAYAPFANEVSTFWLVSATSMRVNNMTLSYSLPSKIAEKYKIPQLRASVTGTNLWVLINHLPYKDPASNVAVDYPILRTFTFTLNASF